jgi:hypothetical protein
MTSLPNRGTYAPVADLSVMIAGSARELLSQPMPSRRCVAPTRRPARRTLPGSCAVAPRPLADRQRRELSTQISTKDAP